MLYQYSPNVSIRALEKSNQMKVILMFIRLYEHQVCPSGTYHQFSYENVLATL